MKSGVTHLLLHPTGMYPSDIPAQVCTETTYPFPARIILSSANANAGYYKQYTIASSLFNIKITNVCQMPRLHALSVPADRCDVSLLYIKQLHTPPGMSCCQPLDNCTNISSITRLGSIIPHQVFNALALALFVFRVLTDYSDTTFSSNNFAFFTNWFN